MNVFTKVVTLGCAALFSSQVFSNCLDRKVVNYIPVGVAVEFCFEQPVVKARWGNAVAFDSEVENGSEIPKEYQKSGIKGLVIVTAREPGIVSNLFVDTGDGTRTEHVLITTDNIAK